MFELLNDSTVNTINRHPKEVFTEILRATGSLDEVNKAISATSLEILRELKVGESGGKLVYDTTSIFEGTSYKGTAFPADVLNPRVIELLPTLTGDDIKPIAEGWRHVEASVHELARVGTVAETAALLEWGVAGLNKAAGHAGAAAAAISGLLAVRDAQTAVNEGDNSKAIGIIADWGFTFGGALAGGAAGGLATGAYFWWLEAVPVVGTAAHGVVTLAGMLGGAYLGVEGVAKVKTVVINAAQRLAGVDIGPYSDPMGSGDGAAIMDAAAGLSATNLIAKAIEGAASTVPAAIAPPIEPLRPSSNNFVLTAGSNSHVAALTGPIVDASGKQWSGGVLDIVAVERSRGNLITLQDVIANNPDITNINNVKAGQVIYIPQKLSDGSVTYHFGGGASINQNSASGEYYMVVPNSNSSGGFTIYERKADGDAGYVVRQKTTNLAGDVVFESLGFQETLNADIRNLSTFRLNNTGSYDATTAVNGAVVAFDATYNAAQEAFRANEIKSINGTLVDAATSDLDSTDLRAIGFVFDKPIGSGVELLLAGANPAAVAANNWASPEIVVTDLGNGLTQRSITLGNGTFLSSIRNEQGLLLSTKQTQLLANGSVIDTSTNQNTDNTQTATTEARLYDAAGAFLSHSNISTVFGADGQQLHKLEVGYNAQGGINFTRMSETQPDGSQKIVERGPSGLALVTTRRQTFHDPDGLSFLDEITNHLTGEVILRSTVGTGPNAETRDTILVRAGDGWNNLDDSIKKQRITDSMYGGAADFLNAARAKDKVGMLLAGGKMALAFSRSDSLAAPGQLDSFLGGATEVAGILGALQGLKSDNALTQIGSAVGLLRNSNDLVIRVTGAPEGFLDTSSLGVLNSIGAVLSIANLANLGDMIDSGHYGSAAFAAANAINGAAFLAGSTTTITGGAVAGGGATVSAGGAGAFIPMDVTTLIIWIAAVIIIDGIFADEEEPPPPPPFGQAVFKRLADGSLGYEIVNAGNGGTEILAAKMDALLEKLNQQVTEANNGNTDPDLALALVASRMPKVSIQSWPSKTDNGVSNFFFLLEQTHPQTGRSIYNGIARQDIVKHYAEALVFPEAIVSQWQVNHLTAKFGADEANWKTEAQWLSAISPVEQQRHALEQVLSSANAALESAKETSLALGSWVAVGEVTGNVEQGTANAAGAVSAAEAQMAAATAALVAFEAQHPSDPQLAAHIVDANIVDPALRAAAIENASRQWLKVIAVDLGGDGVTKTALPAIVKQDYDSLLNDGVARFDADNDGFREATEWIAPTEAMLGIDRDGNGLIDTASELFNGISTPFDQRGLASLKYYDSNNDGKIDAADPVYKLLRLWIDLNGDGSAGSMEIYDLQMRHPGVDMVALRARLDAAGQAAMDALAGSAVQSIDLTTFKLRLADGTDAQASDVGLQAQTEGIAVVVDQATQNVSILHENGLRENYITLVQDMSALLELQNTNITAARRTELEAMAVRYGLNTQSASFMDVVKSLRAGGENIGASGMAIYIGDSDVWVDQNVRHRLEQMRFTFHAASTVGGADVFGTAHFSPPVWAGPSTDTPAFNDQWALSHHVTTGEVTSDTATAGPPAPPNPQQWVLSSDVYTLDYVVKGAQLGGLVTQQAVIASNAATPGAPAQTIQVYTTASPTSSLGAVTVAGKEDEQFAFGYEQLEQEARTLIAGATPYTTVRLLGVREVRHGYVEVDDVTGRIRFIADANYSGTEAGFSYAVMDGQGQVMERRINFNLVEVNDAPTLLGETIQAQEDVPLLLDAATLLANDTDLEGDTLTIIGIGRVGMGRAELLANGQISYKPPTDLYGVTDTIEYIVQDSRGASAVAVIKIKLTAVDDAPTVVSEVIRNAKEDTNLLIDAALLLANDFDPDFNAQAGAAPLRITAVGSAAHGQAFMDSAGQIIFVPDENFNGTATFEYTVTDDTGLSTVGKAEVEVGAVNDGPRAFGEVITSNEDEKLVIDADLLLANDEDADIQRGEQQHLMVVAVDQAVNGTVSLEGGHIVFTPTSNYSGEASFRYTVSDGAGGLSQAVAKVNIAAVNDAPTLLNRAFQGTEETPLNITVSQLLAGVLDAEDGTAGISLVEARNAVGGTLERTGDTFTFTPGANFTGAAHFDYVVQDAQGAESVAVVTMSFNNVNDAPVFVAGSHLAKSGQEDQEVRISLSALKQMFVDVDGDAITVDTTNLMAVNSGDTIRFDAQTQEIVFKAKANANGTRQFDVRVQDSNGVYSAYERLDVGIQALNDAPIVNAVGFQMLEDGGYNDPGLQAWSYISYGSLLSGSSDAEGDALSIVGAINGRTLDGRVVNIVNDAANNRVGILAPLNYNGAITFDFTVSDGHGAQVSQRAYGNVVAVNDLPTANVVVINSPGFFGPVGISAYYRLDTYDVEDGANSTVSVERNPLWGSVQQGVTSAYVFDTYIDENGTVYQLGEGGWREVAAPANYFSVPMFRVGQSASDSATFRITDSQGGFNFRSVNFFIQGYDPVVIDLGGDGLEFLDIDESQVTVDRDGDGVAQHVAWIGANEGILAWDHNHDNQINLADEVEFWSHVNPQDPARTDLQSLARPEFDTNQDGKFDSSDAKWAEFKLWRDLNGNGVSDAGELQTLAEAGLKALYLNANVLNRRYGEDVLVRGYTRAEMTDGRMLQAGDVQLGIEDPDEISGTTPPVSGQDAEVIAVTDAQALAQQEQQLQAAAMRAGTPEFSGALRDQKVLTGQSYRYVLPEALFSNLGAGTHYTVMLASGQPLPAWLHFDAVTRTLSGSPSEGQTGEWTLKVVGTDAGNAVSAGVMTLSVAQFNQAPVEYGRVPIQFADEDQLFALDIAPNFFIDKDVRDQLHFSATLADGSPLPDWLHFDAQAMRFYGTPGGGNVGTVEVKLTAADEANATADTRFKIVVTGINDAPYLTGPVPTIGMTAGVANSFVMPQNLFTDQDLGDVLRLSVSVADGSPLPPWLTYDSATRTLFANPTAEQISAPLQLRVTATDLAGVSTSTLMTVASMIQGTAADDALIGSAYSEYIWGDAGNDLLDGQAGADRLIGGSGNDRYIVDALDIVVEKADEGMDTVFSAGNWTLGDNLENLTLTGHLTVNATGNSLANVLSGNSADNILSGGAGDDVYLFGFGSGHDTLVENAEAGAGTDRVQFLAGVSVSDVWVSADANYVYLNLVDGTNRLAIQRVAGGGIGVESVCFADGTNWDQAAVMSRIVPNPAPLSAAPGYFRIATEDLLFEDTSPGTWFTTNSPSLTYWARLGNGGVLPSWLTLDPITGKFSGLPQNGDVAAFEVRLYVKDSYGAVSSTLVQFLVTNTNDAPTAAALVNEQVGKNQAFVYVLPSNTFADVDVGDALTLEATRSNGGPLPSWLTFDAATRTFSGTPPANADETVKISVRATDSSGAFVLTGFSLDIGNMMTGTAAAETLTGTAGRDLMYGLDGNDTLNAGTGNDLLDGGTGADVLNGGAGDDIYVIDNAGDSVVETTSTTTYVDQGHYATAYTDQGYYRYYVGVDESGVPYYTSNQNYDEYGNPLYTPQWVSVMVPYTYWVPNVVAQTVVSDSGGVDTVNASVNYALGVNQENLTLTGSGAINGTGNALNNVLTGNVANNTLDSGAGADTLDGGAGDDLLIGGQGNDRYIYARGYGRDTVSDADTTANNMDTLSMQAGIVAGDVTVTRTATQMVLSLSASDQVLIDWDVASGKRIERVEFADGTVWTANDLLLMSNRAPTFAAPANQSAAEDAVWSYTLPAGTFADLDAGDVLSYSARLADGSALPGWLSFNAATRTFSGTPLNANVGLLALKVTATDTQGETVSGTVNVTVTNTNDAPTVLATLQNQQAIEDQAFSFVMPVGTFGDVDAGDVLTYSASLVNGAALPSWLTFNAATRTFSGAPLNANVGTLALKVIATDTAGAAVSSTFNVTVANTNDAPTVLLALQNQQVNEDQAFSYAVPAGAFGDVDVGDVLTYSASLANGAALPSWLIFNAATRTFSGTPLNAHVGTVALQVTVTDMAGAAISSVFNVTVTNTNDAPTVVTPLQNQQANETQAFSYVLPVGTFSDVDVGDSLVLSATLAGGAALPSWLTFNAATRTLSGTPPDTAAGIMSLAIKATDAAGASVLAGFSLDIANVINGTTSAETMTGTTGRDLMYGLDGNDTLNAGIGNDLLDGGAGADVLNGGAGDDIYVVDNAGDSVVETTSTTTYVDQGHYTTTYTDQGYYRYYYYNEGSVVYLSAQGYDEYGNPMYTPEWVSVMVPQTYWVPNVVAQTVVSDSGGVDTVNASISYTLGVNQENLTLTGSAAINGTGNALNNVLAGNSANNVLAGGGGSDTYLLGRGANTDTIQENDNTAGNNDVVKFMPSVAVDQIWFRQVNNDLEASIVGTGDKFIISNWYLGAQYRVEEFKTTDGGKTLLASQVQNLVSAMAAFSPPAAGETTLPSNYSTALAPVIAANWQ
ncbi:putative Ig domain-containing protein [Polaromonas sp.]|uniref:putative Ig domain-containing protein n=1 Tax=Polaromonas sp. TaxID=1869339 RepID=UPI0032632A2B